MKLIVRQLAKEDFEPYKKLFDEAYYEYLEIQHLTATSRYDMKT